MLETFFDFFNRELVEGYELRSVDFFAWLALNFGHSICLIMKLKQKSIRKFRFCHFPDKREWKFYLLHKFNQRYLSFMSKNDDFF